MKDFNISDFVEMTDEELKMVSGGQALEFLGGFSALNPSSDPVCRDFYKWCCLGIWAIDKYTS
ncbi:MAG: hypothetical protein LBI13_04905 [Streptococcaceae bacterium]|jgi:hypothetical protein|nr:hypothetical protein [Streptococcaceae bacterium]